MEDQNVGTVDRIIRGIIGLTLIILGVFVIDGSLGFTLSLVGILPIFTAVLGVCPCYEPLNINTNKRHS